MEEELDSLGQSLLHHLLRFRGHQVRFEADSHTTEFGICRTFPEVDIQEIRSALRTLENFRWIYRRVQYVIGFSEPKLVFSLTPNGYRKAQDIANARAPVGAVANDGSETASPIPVEDGPVGPPEGQPRRPPRERDPP